ncbi:pseudaminic acid biosynthesis-associated methylase [Alsobacter sp. R-9]
MNQTGHQIGMWRGEFGDRYIERNAATDAALRARTQLWAEILSGLGAAQPQSILEVGANIGINLRALRNLTAAEFFAVEPNDKAREKLVADGVVGKDRVRPGVATAIDFPDETADLAFTSGVLIHVPPADLERSCREIYRCARRYIVCIEYFSDKAESIHYRGHDDLLFKRDFGGFWLDLYPDLEPVKWGFAWKRTTGLDNLTWWLFRK